MKVLLVHNSHRSGSSSGDDTVFRSESDLLISHGHKVICFNPSNDEFDNGSLLRKISLVVQIPWSFSSSRLICNIIRREKPDLAHIHNIFPLISPSIYHVLKEERIPVVQTLHDFRFLCAMAFFLRDGRICEECKENSVFRSVRHGCFNGSRIQTIPVAIMLKLHQYIKTFKEKIDAYICLTESQKKLFIGAGFDEQKLFVKPNFVHSLSNTTWVNINNGDYVVYIGRLGEEKGLKTMIKAWQALLDIPLKIIGNGPFEETAKKMVRAFGIQNIEFLGYRSHDECMEILKGSRFLIMPSIWHETFGLVIVEAFACFKPVIASNLGAMADLVRNGVTGYLFETGNAAELAAMVRLLWFDRVRCITMGKNARKEYEEKYTPEKNYKMLMDIYEKAIAMHKKGQ